MGAKKSSTAKIRFKFKINKDQYIESKIFDLKFWAPKNTYFSKKDGDFISRKDSITGPLIVSHRIVKLFLDNDYRAAKNLCTTIYQQKQDSSYQKVKDLIEFFEENYKEMDYEEHQELIKKMRYLLN